MKIQTFGTKMSLLIAIGAFSTVASAQQNSIQPASIHQKNAQKGTKNLAITDCFSMQYSAAFGNPTFLKYPSNDYHLIQFIFNRNKQNHLYLFPSNESINDSNGLLFIQVDSFSNALKSSLITFNQSIGDSSTNVNVKLMSIPRINWFNSISGWFEYNGYVVNVTLTSNQNWSIESNSLKFVKPLINLTPQDAKKEKSALSVSLTMKVIYKVEENDGTSLSSDVSNTSEINQLRTAYIKQNNLYIVGNDQKATQITFDGKEGIVYGQSVHRNEFGINGGLFWSNDLNQLAFYRMDEQRVKKYPMFAVRTRPAQPTEIRYPMSGDSSHTVTLGVYNTITGETIYLNTLGSYDHYLTNITWSPDGKSIYLFWVNRDQNKTELREYSSTDGNLIKTHLEYTHPKYTEPESGLIFSKSIPEGFIFQSEHSGFNHLYLYLKNNSKIPKNNKPFKNTQTFADGGVLNHYGYLFPITQGNWEVTEVLGLDESIDQIIYLSTYSSNGSEQGALNRVPMMTNILTGSTKTINIISSKQSSSKNPNQSEVLEEYVQSAQWIPANKKLLIQASTTSQPLKLYSVDLSYLINRSKPMNSNPIANLLYSASNPTIDFNMGEVKIESIENQGVKLFQRTFLPPNFDATKKYPVVVYLYGGPHAQMVTNGWLGGGNLWMAYMASEGYIVYTLDNRGSSHRGLNFENATHRNLGTIEMLDQLAGLEYLKSLPYVDSTRIGVHGWSFGGFMTTSLMTRYAGKYKVGVAGGPVIDWSYYEIMYTERYMDRPEENPLGYSQNNLLNYAQNLKGPLLMIHGADDDVVVWQHSLLFADKCVKTMNTKLDYFVYPGHKHNVVGRDRAHLYKKISEYFFEKL
jgi:dipeptidyl-peptidase-4